MSTFVMRAGRFVVLAFVLASCAPVADDEVGAGVTEVVRGVRARGRHPAVVALLTASGGICSGALIAPDVVLTARHCVSLVTPEIVCPSAANHVLLDLPPSSITVVVADDVRGASAAARGARTLSFPSRNLCGADLALLVLDRALRGIDPIPVDTRAMPDMGDTVTVVGYGRRGDSARAGVGVRFLREAVPVRSGTRAEFVTGEGPCNGDSGSPALDGHTGRVVGVLSRGTERCVGPDANAVWTRAWVARTLLEQVR
jgi:secreted trypsin-like serine protease